MSSSDWQSDAKLAGTLYKRAKPYTAMLIARSVEPGVGEGGDHDRHRPTVDSGEKVSLRTFADHADMSTTTVSKYLRAWEAMAEAGIVPFPDQLQPGEDVEVPDQKVWTYYYREANPPKPKKEQPKKEVNPENPNMDGRVELEGKRVVTALSMAAGIETPNPAIQRMAEALVDLAMSDNPNRAYVAACSALADLAASIK